LYDGDDGGDKSVITTPVPPVPYVVSITPVDSNLARTKHLCCGEILLVDVPPNIIFPSV
jgi:hypothetical protein